MTKSELKELEELLVDVEESNDKIDLIEAVYFWCLRHYREQGKKKLSIEEFRDDLSDYGSIFLLYIWWDKTNMFRLQEKSSKL